VGRFCAATVVYFYSGLWWIIAPALTVLRHALAVGVHEAEVNLR